MYTVIEEVYKKMNKLRPKLIFLVIIELLFSSCVSTKNATSYAVDYEEEHKSKQDFEFNNADALDLCKNGWFVINIPELKQE